MPTPLYEPLRKLLADMFTAEELRQLLWSHGGKDLVDSLPATSVGDGAYAGRAAEVLFARGALTDELFDAWVAERPLREDEIRALHAQVDGRRATPTAACPYRGLEAFRVDDTGLFFGREVLTERLVARLASNEARFLAIVGPSGSGKSSVAQAGVIAKLGSGALPGSAEWPVVALRPGGDPLETLAVRMAGESLLNGGVAAVKELIDQLAADPRALHLAVRLAVDGQPEARRVLVLVDQFEELFTLCADEPTRRAFVAGLLHAATAADGRAIVLITLRADFYGKCAAYPELAAALSDHQVLIGAMTADELRTAIEAPARQAGLELEDGLAELLVEQVENRPGALPLLQFVLEALWRDRDGPRLTHAAYRGMGGLEGAISHRADAWLATVGERQIATVRAIFGRLVELGEGTDDTRRRERRDVLATIAPGVAEPLVANLVAERLLTAHRDEVEVAHEALIREWGTLRAWIEQNREAWRLGQEIQRAARHWVEHDRATGELWRGARLARARELANQGALELTADERAFVHRSHRAIVRARRLAIAAVAIAFAVVASLGAWAVVERDAAEDGRQEARRQQERATLAAEEAVRQEVRATASALIAQAERIRESDPTAAVVLLREVPVNSVEDVWRNVAVRVGEQPVARVVLRGHEAAVVHAEYSPDGTRVVTASKDNTARVWSADGRGQPVVLGTTLPTTARFSPDGARVLMVSDFGVVRVWNADGRGEPVTLARTAGSARFSPDGTRVVTFSSDDRDPVAIRDADGTGQPRLLTGHTDVVYSAKFSPDGARVVTASNDGTARVWSADRAGSHIVLLKHAATAAVAEARFSPDGTRIVTVYVDGSSGYARIWRADTGTLLAQTALPSGPANSPPLIRFGRPRSSAQFSRDGTRVVIAAGSIVRVWKPDSDQPPIDYEGASDDVLPELSPDGTRVVIASSDGTAQIRGVNPLAAIVTLRGHLRGLSAARFSPDGQTVVTASHDGTARIWAVDGRARLSVVHRELGDRQDVFGAWFSPDGERIAIVSVTLSRERAIRVWNTDGPGIPRLLESGGGPVTMVDLSPDGTRGVSIGDTVQVWNANGTGDPITLQDEAGFADCAQFSPDSTRVVVTHSATKTARIWNADGTGDPIVLEGHTGIRCPGFSPDGTRVVTAAEDSTARIWNANGSGDPIVLRHRDCDSGCVAFSPDGTRVLTASPVSDTCIWNADGTGDPVVLRGHTGMAGCPRFSPDGTRVLVLDDRIARLWNADGTGDPVVLRGHADDIGKASFSPDGTRVLTTSDDHTVRVWNADGTGQPLVLQDEAMAAQFSSDGTRVLTFSQRAGLQIWLIDPTELHDRMWRATTYCLTVEERQQYLLEDAATAERKRADCQKRVEAIHVGAGR